MERLTDTDTYRSPGREIPWLVRTFPTPAYYARLAGIVLRASRKGKRGRYDSAEWVKSSLEVVRAMEWVGARFEVENMSSFQGLDPPCVFIGNHMSTLETFALPCMIRPFREVTFVVKKSLVVLPVIRHVIIARWPIVVGRKNPRDDLKAVLKEGLEYLGRGISMIVFPQTTRRPVFDPAQFNSIGVKLARRAGVPVIPLAVKTDAWGLGWPLKDLGKIDPSRTVRFSFGDPLTVTGTGKEEHEEVVRFITDKLDSWSGEGS